MQFYIDPGTGSMLFTILIGVIGAAVYSVRMFLIKMKFRLSGGKAETGGNKIPLAIFSDDKRYWKIFEPICRELEKQGMPVVYLTQSADDPGLSTELSNVTAECIGADNKAFARLNYLNATILLSTTPGLDIYQWKRSPDVDWYVHIPHAPTEVVTYRMFGLDYYDAVLLSGDYQCRDIRHLEALRGLPEKELTMVGIPYMDEMAARLAGDTPLPEHRRTVLLAPSWGKSAILSRYGGAILDALLETGYHVIVRPHPQSFTSEKELLDDLMRRYPDSGQLEWNRDTDNYQVLRRADIMISDFSGVAFDYALVYDKPIIYTDPDFDLGVYDAWWLDYPIWTVGALPRIGCLLTEENRKQLKDTIDTCLESGDYARGRREVKAETWCCPGEGAARAAEYLMNKYRALTEKEGTKA